MEDIIVKCKKCKNEEVINVPTPIRKKCNKCGRYMRVPVYGKPKSSKIKEPPLVNPHDEPTTLMNLWCESKKPIREISDDLFRYKVVMCPNCGRIQMTEGERGFRCRSCNKASKYRVKGKWHVKIYSFPTPGEATAFMDNWQNKGK
ncbi:MAG: hypothetical protein MSIBF_02360 [Candidatus Altiarchaeales archaeon IMC4]|nr:MAG: hypothetical protein MSIBF_02360 [Candidatus Altiarchaeales archaeon IMC4]